jgi:hypothetical protein
VFTVYHSCFLFITLLRSLLGGGGVLGLRNRGYSDGFSRGNKGG